MPMILVDTSVWIAYFRASDKHLTAHLQAFLEEDQVALAIPVKIEILCGSPPREWTRLRRSLEALPLLMPSNSTWERIERWVEQAVVEGERFGMADLLIAALAVERGAELWSLDSDFTRMQKLDFVRLHTPS
jgi:predicted nucleic acid-binding protein